MRGIVGRRYVLIAVGALAVLAGAERSQAASDAAGIHEGVASCGGSTCHSRLVPSGAVVRQNEIITWQDASSAAGAHSRAWTVLEGRRAAQIADRLGLGPAAQAPSCLGCHADAVAPAQRGPRFQISDGVGCEACHGGSGAWLAGHYATDATHAANLAAGMTALEDPKTRAGLCLDCHLSSGKPGQFVTHRMMAAGHPRITFELDLFSSLQRHYDIDADYAKRKTVAGGAKFWAVGQALAVARALDLYANPALGQEGAFPEFDFFDCQGCHRRIFDDPGAALTALANPARPVPPGTPVFDDENMIMLSAVAHVAAPGRAGDFDGAARAFHAALVQDRAAAVAAGGRLAGAGAALAPPPRGAAFHAALVQDRAAAVAAGGRLAAAAHGLADALAGHAFGRGETLAVLKAVLDADRYTDYGGASQAVMAADTLLSALGRGEAQAARPGMDRLYAQVRDANDFNPAAFRAAMQSLAGTVGRF